MEEENGVCMTYSIVPYTDRPDWLAKRRQGLGASDVAAVMGVSPWSTPRQCWLSKVEPDAPEPMSNEDMEWGLTMEAAILNEATKRLGADIVLPGPLLRNDERPWMMATPDALCEVRVLSEMVIVEAKKVDAWNWEEIPPYYLMQVQWQMAVTGYQKAYVAALHRGRRLELYPVEADEEVQAELIEAGGRFWTLVESVEPPPVEAADNDYLAGLWPDHVEAAVEVPEELAAEMRTAKESLAIAKENLDFLSAQVKDLMGTADTAVVGQQVVATWRTQTRTRFDVKALRAEDPDIADTYTKSGTSRVFRIKT